MTAPAPERGTLRAAGAVVAVALLAVLLLLVLWIDGGRATFVRAGVGAFVGFLAEDERRARGLFGELPVSPAAARRRADAIQRLASIAIVQGRAVHHLPGDEGPRTDLGGAMLIGGTRQAMLDFIDGRLHTDQTQFVDDLARYWISLGDAAN